MRGGAHSADYQPRGVAAARGGGLNGELPARGGGGTSHGLVVSHVDEGGQTPLLPVWGGDDGQGGEEGGRDEDANHEHARWQGGEPQPRAARLSLGRGGGGKIPKKRSGKTKTKRKKKRSLWLQHETAEVLHRAINARSSRQGGERRRSGLAADSLDLVEEQASHATSPPRHILPVGA